MNKKRILIGITLLSLILNIYTISTLMTISNKAEVQINANIKNTVDIMGLYGSSIVSYLDDPSESIHNQLVLYSYISNFINNSNQFNLNWGAFGKGQIGNHKIISAINRVNTHIMFVTEAAFSKIRLDSAHEKEILYEILDEEYLLFLKEFSVELKKFTRNVLAYYELSYDEKGKKSDFEKNIILQSERLEKLIVKGSSND